jgi:hypothetical protein
MHKTLTFQELFLVNPLVLPAESLHLIIFSVVASRVDGICHWVKLTTNDSP